MRCSPRAARSAGLGGVLGLVVALAGCTPPSTTLCVRNSDCPAGQVCTTGGSCTIAPDASTDALTDGAGSAAGDAATDDAAAVGNAAQPAGEAAPWSR
jgi:Cys-rich repeat protein